MKPVRLAALLAVLAGFSAGALGQIHGTPPSVSSLGGRRTFVNPPGIPASVTSLGPGGFQNLPCCGNFGSQVVGRRSSFGFSFGTFKRHHGRHFRHGLVSAWPVYVPYYVPVIYAAEPYDEDNDEPPARVERRKPSPRTEEEEEETAEEQAPAAEERKTERGQKGARSASANVKEKRVEAPPAPPAEQEITVLVYQNGKRREVRNYAIIGTTLYDFSGNRALKIALKELDLEATKKANEERGVAFIVPVKK